MVEFKINKGLLKVNVGVTELPRDPSANGCVGKGYFQGDKDIVEVELPLSLMSIGDWAFRNCKNLKKIEIPSSVTKLEHLVFAGCESLEEIVVPDSVSKMQTGDFQDCTKLKKVKLSKKVKEIQDNTFSGCKSLQEVEFSDNLTSFGRSCFKGCKSLKEIHIKKKVNNIEVGAFEGCSGVEKITVDSENTLYTSFPGSNAVFVGTKLIIGCKNTIIPKNTTIIAHYSFDGCSNLKTITIPEGVEEIEKCAFNNCTNLEEVFLPSTIKNIDDDCFVGCDKLSKIHINKGNKILYSGKNENILVCNGKLLYFYGKSIPEGENFTEIGKYAFKKPGITELIIPEKVKKLGPVEFYCKEVIKKLKNEDGASIHIDYVNSSFKKLYIPSSLEEIDIKSFQNVDDIEEIIVAEENKTYDSREGCNAIIRKKDNCLILACKNTVIPEGVEAINCEYVSKKKIKSLILPKSLKYIETIGTKKVLDELTILSDDVVIGYEAWKGYWHNPFETNNICATKIKGSKTVIEKIKKIYENSSHAPKFIEK